MNDDYCRCLDRSHPNSMGGQFDDHVEILTVPDKRLRLELYNPKYAKGSYFIIMGEGDVPTVFDGDLVVLENGRPLCIIEHEWERKLSAAILTNRCPTHPAY